MKKSIFKVKSQVKYTRKAILGIKFLLWSKHKKDLQAIQQYSLSTISVYVLNFLLTICS